MLGAEIHGRSYGGGILKMEPREATVLPMPNPEALQNAWVRLRDQRDHLDRQLQDGVWTNVVKHVDQVLLQETLGLDGNAVAVLREAAASMRARRISQ